MDNLNDVRPLDSLFEMYLVHRLGMASDSTISQFRITLAHFARFLGHAPTTNDLTDSNVLRFMQHRVMVDGKAIRTANKHRDNLCALWRFLARKQLVTIWPDVPPLPEPQREPQAWSRNQLASLFAACASQQGKIGGVQAGRWWLALHAVLWDTGERIGAIMQAAWQHVDAADRWLYVPAEHRKGKRKDHTFRLHADTVTALEAIRLPQRELVFPFDTPSYSTLWYRYGCLLKKAGLPNGRESKFHRVRKSTASWFEAAGGNATNLLGHSGRRVTEKYLDPRVVTPPQASDMLFRPGCCD